MVGHRFESPYPFVYCFVTHMDIKKAYLTMNKLNVHGDKPFIVLLNHEQ